MQILPTEKRFGSITSVDCKFKIQAALSGFGSSGYSATWWLAPWLESEREREPQSEKNSRGWQGAKLLFKEQSASAFHPCDKMPEIIGVEEDRFDLAQEKAEREKRERQR